MDTLCDMMFAANVWNIEIRERVSTFFMETGSFMFIKCQNVVEFSFSRLLIIVLFVLT